MRVNDNAERSLRIPAAPHRPDPAAWSTRAATFAWLGHATVLANLHGRRVLVDPVLEARIGVRFGPVVFGPKRLVAPALRVAELPPIDLLLLTHAHMDHLDLRTLRQLPRTTPVIVQRGMRDLVRRFSDVTELAWHERWTRDDLAVTAIPTRHWGARTVWDTHRGFGGFVVEQSHAEGRTRILYAGDTAATDLFDPLADSGIDVAILPIGAYDPWIWNHCSPEEAWALFLRLGARWMLPVHHATFRLSNEPTAEPIERLLRAADPARVALTEIGETFVLPAAEPEKMPPPAVPTSTRVPGAAAIGRSR